MLAPEFTREGTRLESDGSAFFEDFGKVFNGQVEEAQPDVEET